MIKINIKNIIIVSVLIIILGVSFGISVLAATGPSGYSFCVNENQNCFFTGPHDVAYGANGKFNYKENMSSKFSCNNTTFGDPAPGVQKACFIRPNLDVLTGAYTDLTDSSAKLTGSVNPKSKPTFGYFRYSTANVPPVFCNDIYGSDMRSTNEVYIGDGNEPMTFPTEVSYLWSNTTYYYCAIGSNKDEIKYGGVKSFTTKLTPGQQNLTTSIETRQALVASKNSAYLNGFYNTIVPASTWFEYRKSLSIQDIINAGQITATMQAVNSAFNNNPISISPNLNSSSRDTTNTTNGATNINSVNTNARTSTNSSVWIKVGITANGNGKNHAAGTSGPISYLLTGLTPNTGYQFRAVLKSSKINYGNILSFRTLAQNTVTPGVVPGGEPYENACANVNDPNCNGTGNNIREYPSINFGTTSGTLGVPGTPLVLNQIATPSPLALVGPGEGVETVFARQIVANTQLAKMFGYVEGTDLQSFAWSLAHYFGKIFGYVNKYGKEVRVSYANIAAYELRLEGYGVTVYEYYNSKIIGIQNTTSIFKNRFFYEYYFNKK